MGAVYSFTLKSTSTRLAKMRFEMSSARKHKDGIMFGILAAVLIVLWLLGFFAFHVTTSFIHIALVVGLILLVLHFMRGSTASV